MLEINSIDDFTSNPMRLLGEMVKRSEPATVYLNPTTAVLLQVVQLNDAGKTHESAQ